MAQRQGGSDVDIIVSLQDEDPSDGIRLLTETHGGKVRGWLRKTYRGVLDDLQVDAAFNTAVYQIWKFAPSYDESKGTLCGCFLVFARNAAVSMLRGEHKHYRKRTDFEEILKGDLPDGHACDEPPPPGSKREKLIADFQSAVKSLPPLQRAIVEADLEADGQASGSWLAEKLGKPLNSIYVNRGRALENLRKRMIEMGHYRD